MKFNSVTKILVIFNFSILLILPILSFTIAPSLAQSGIPASNQGSTIDNTETTTRRTLRRGSRGEDVKYLQRRLTGLKYGSLVADGIFGAATEQAVKRFQRQQSLTVDGIVGAITWAKLEQIDI